MHLRHKMQCAEYEPDVEPWESDTDEEDEGHLEIDIASGELSADQLRVLMC